MHCSAWVQCSLQNGDSGGLMGQVPTCVYVYEGLSVASGVPHILRIASSKNCKGKRKTS